MHHILEYKWDEHGISINNEGFSNYEALTSIMKVANSNFRLVNGLFFLIKKNIAIFFFIIIKVTIVKKTDCHSCARMAVCLCTY